MYSRRIAAVVLLLFTVRVSAAGRSPLLDAIRNHDRKAVAAAVSARVDVNAPDADGTTALHLAANWGDLETVDLLLRSGARVDAPNRYGITPILVAASSGDARILDRLLRAGADPGSANKEGETVLMLAARAGSVPAVKRLLAAGASPDAKEGWRGQTTLMWAAIEGHGDVVRTLLEGGADLAAKSKTGFTSLLFAIRAGDADVTRTLLDAGADANDRLTDGTGTLVMAALNAHWEIGQLLLARGADPNADAQGWTALHQVALTRNPHHDNVAPQPIPTGRVDSLDFVRDLIARGADLNRRTKKSPTDGFRQWIRRDGATAFFLAAKAADVPLMELLVAKGADPLIPTNAHVTPLAAAAGVGFCQGESPGTEAEALTAVKLTLKLGGDVNAADDDGFTPMHGAATRGANSIVQFLYERGAVLDAKSKEDGWTPWTMANGVMLANTYKRQLATAEYLTALMAKASR